MNLFYLAVHTLKPLEEEESEREDDDGKDLNDTHRVRTTNDQVLEIIVLTVIPVTHSVGK